MNRLTAGQPGVPPEYLLQEAWEERPVEPLGHLMEIRQGPQQALAGASAVRPHFPALPLHLPLAPPVLAVVWEAHRLLEYLLVEPQLLLHPRLQRQALVWVLVVHLQTTESVLCLPEVLPVLAVVWEQHQVRASPPVRPRRRLEPDAAGA